MNEQEKFSPNADAEAVSAETKAPNELSPTAASDTLSADMPATEQTCENADNAAQPSQSIEASPSQPEINPEIKSEQCSEDNARSKSIEYKSVLDELRELAFAEAANIDYLPQPVTQLRRKSHTFLKTFIILLIVFIILFFTTARAVFGKGWIKNMANKSGNFQSFTIPTVSHPELEEKYYQADGRYTVEGVANVASASIVTIEAYVESTVFAAYGQGSGVIMTEDGYIITNAHVIDGAQLAIIVRLQDGTEYNATVVGSDIKSDLAVIKINASGLTPAQFGDSEQLSLGEQVVAIGSPAGLESSVTTGIVSGLNRMIKVESTNISMNCVQIDAAINPGNSGGALLNMWGQVVGITSSKLEAIEFDNIGFAISMNAAKPIIEELIEHGAILGRPRIGISFLQVSDTEAMLFGTVAGLRIAEISPDCDIANTELQPNDVITAMNGIEVRSADDVYDIIYKLKPGDEVEASVTRVKDDGAQEHFTIKFKLMEDTSASIKPEESNVKSDE